MGLPARGYSWAPFEKGNTVGRQFPVIHGAYSPRKVDPLAKELVKIMLAAVDYLHDPSYAPALWAWARAEARVQLLTEYVDRHCVDANGDLKGEVSEVSNRARDDLLRWERHASRERERLGLDPLSRAKLGKDISAGAFDLARMFEEMGNGREKAEATP